MEDVMDVGGDDFVIPTKHVSKRRARRTRVKVADRKRDI
jgi:hypothetical protein